jgi:uncharacterized membrane protein YbhN (UPF0104 family)
LDIFTLYNRMDKKKISFWKITIAIIISLISIVFIFYRLSLIPAQKVNDILAAFSTPSHIGLLIVVFVLMLANWSIEALKWRMLLKPRVNIGFGKATASVISGISLGAITPSRIGEFAGRIFYLKDQDKIFGTVASFTGGFAQNIITIFTGLICMIFYIMIFDHKMVVDEPLMFYLVFILSIVVIILLLLFYLNLSYFIDKISHWRIIRKLEDYLPHTADWNSRDLGIVLLYSFIRYSIFSTQYLVLLNIFGIPVPVQEQAIIVGLIFMLTTFIPSYSASDVANKISVSMVIFNNPSLDLAVAAASLTLWVINLALPGLIGNFLLIKESRTNK